MILLVTGLCLCLPNPLAQGAGSLSSHCDVSRSEKHDLGHSILECRKQRNRPAAQSRALRCASRLQVVQHSFQSGKVTVVKIGHDSNLRNS
jgi:hypothetical protein